MTTVLCILSLSSAEADAEEQQADQIPQVPTCSRTNQSQENTKAPIQPQVAVMTETLIPTICRSGKSSMLSVCVDSIRKMFLSV